MSTVVRDTSNRLAEHRRPSIGHKLPAAVLGSRLLVLAGAVTGATLMQRSAAWRVNDPQHLTLRLGWLGNILGSASVRWDALHYLAVAQHGYRTASSSVFFPLYPLLIHVCASITHSYAVAGIVVSTAAFGVAMLLLHRLTGRELGTGAADATVLLLAFSPLSLFFTAIYTESLFLALCLGAFLLARNARWGWSGVAAAAATLTHIEGVLLVVPLAGFYWAVQRETVCAIRSAADARRPVLQALPLLVPLLALAAFLLYLHSRGYGWLAPSANQSGYRRHFVGPVLGTARGVAAGIAGLVHMINGTSGTAARDDAFQNVVSLLVLVMCLASLWLAWKRLPKSYSVFCALYLLVCVSSPATGEPLMSLDRFVLALFPLWMVSAHWLVECRRLGVVIAICGALLFVLSMQFARWAFIG